MNQKLLSITILSVLSAISAHASEITCRLQGQFARTLVIHHEKGERPVLEGFEKYPLLGHATVDRGTGVYVYRFNWAYTFCGGVQIERQTDGSVRQAIDDFIYSEDCGDARRNPVIVLDPAHPDAARLIETDQERDHAYYFGVGIPGSWGETRSATDSLSCEIR